MQRVRHQHAIEALQVEGAGEVRDDNLESALKTPEGARVLIYGGDLSVGAHEVGQSQGESALAGSEVGPATSPFPNSVLNQRYEICVCQLARAPAARPQWRTSSSGHGRR